MPYPIPAPETTLARFFLVIAGQPVPVKPSGGDALSLEPGEGNDIGPFYYRKKLAGPLVLSGADYRLLLGREQSNARCQPMGLLVETRLHLRADWQAEYVGTFTCNECEWDHDKGTVGIKPTTDDAYRLLTEGWDQEYNLLAVPDAGATRRRPVSAQLAVLSAALTIEFLRIDTSEEVDYVGTDGWTTFLRDTSYIAGPAGTFAGSTRQHFTIIFRYRRQAKMVLANGVYTPVNLSAGGWAEIGRDTTVTPPTVDYAKEPEIAGFKAYKIGGYNDYNDPNNGANTSSQHYGDQLVVLPCNATPSLYGYDNNAYLKITGSGGGQSLGGAYNTETAPCLNLRRATSFNQPKSVWWRFGDFHFTRCIPLLDALYGLLQLTIQGPPPAAGEPAYPVPAGLSALLPPSAAYLSDFFTNPLNPATGDTGDANELPRLLVAAASDVKRYGASEPATRLLVSLKALLTDLAALYDVGAFVDPATGWLRIEHRSYLAAARQGGAVLDLTAIAEATLPRAYTYRQQQLPRFEELTVANASTEDEGAALSFRTAAIRYASDCANPREGQNRVTTTVSKLTGDIAALVLSGNSIPDNAIALLAPDSTGRLADGNAAVSATRLLRRYHREGRVRASGASVGAVPLLVGSTRPGLEQAECSAPLGTLRGLDDATTQLITSLGSGAIVGKATLNLKTGIVKITPWLPTPEPTADAPAVGRQFSDQFPDQFA